VGIFYLAWQALAADAVGQVDAASRINIEDVIRTDGATFGDILLNPGVLAHSGSFHYQVEPQLGYYCLYRARDGETPYAEPNYVPDCAGITEVLTAHATQLWEAGVDFIYADATNLPFMSDFADVIGVRPLEVLFEEWQELRDAGTMTPQIAVWLPIPAKQAGQESLTYLYERVLEVYNDPAYEDLVLRDKSSGKKVLFIVDHGALEPDPTIEASIRGNGGRDDIVTPHLWGNLPDGELAAGVAGWMQPCEQGGQFTTIIDPAVLCHQGYTTTSPLGTVVSVSASYQVGYASLPYQAAGKNFGLTFKQQFDTALAVQPDYLLLNSWNEFIAQPQANPHVGGLGDLGRSMGVTTAPTEPGDTSRDWLWVDGYGAEFSRDMEPTVEEGEAYYELMRSCIALYKSGATACKPVAHADVACCARDPELTLIYSLRKTDANNALDTEHVMTASTVERDTLTGSGAWEQVCNPAYAPPGLCGQGADLSADGPFSLLAQPGTGRELVYRCHTGVTGFFSLDAACEGATVVGPLGYLSTTRTSHTPRPLSRCYHPTAHVHFHWLGGHCPGGVNHEALLGYVR